MATTQFSKTTTAPAHALSLVADLEDHLLDLADELEPLLSHSSSLQSTTAKLPLLDRAKLNVTLVCAIDSLLFSYLKIHGPLAKEHKIYNELSRVKVYFSKIKDAEAGATLVDGVGHRDNMHLNKEAAARIIKHSLAGNTQHDLAKAEAEARQKFLAKRKLKALEDGLKETTGTGSSPASVAASISGQSNTTTMPVVHGESTQPTNLTAAALQVNTDQYTRSAPTTHLNQTTYTLYEDGDEDGELVEVGSSYINTPVKSTGSSAPAYSTPIVASTMSTGRGTDPELKSKKRKRGRDKPTEDGEVEDGQYADANSDASNENDNHDNNDDDDDNDDDDEPEEAEEGEIGGDDFEEGEISDNDNDNANMNTAPDPRGLYINQHQYQHQYQHRQKSSSSKPQIPKVKQKKPKQMSKVERKAEKKARKKANKAAKRAKTTSASASAAVSTQPPEAMPAEV